MLELAFLLFYYLALAFCAVVWWTLKLMILLAIVALALLRLAGLWVLRKWGERAAEPV